MNKNQVQTTTKTRALTNTHVMVATAALFAAAGLAFLSLSLPRASFTRCVETDSGYDIATQGTTKGYHRRSRKVIKRTDTCNKAGELIEYFCTKRGINAKRVTCPENQSCNEGQCVADRTVEPLVCNDAHSPGDSFGVDGTEFTFLSSENADGPEPKVYFSATDRAAPFSSDVGIRSSFTFYEGGLNYYFAGDGDFSETDYNITPVYPCDQGADCSQTISVGDQFRVEGVAFRYLGIDDLDTPAGKAYFKNLDTDEEFTRDIGYQAVFPLTTVEGVVYTFTSAGNFHEDNYDIALLYPCESITLVPKRCDEVESASPHVFEICGENGYEYVCLNKYSGAYQGCTREADNGCTERNMNADRNMLCESTLPSTATTTPSTTSTP